MEKTNKICYEKIDYILIAVFTVFFAICVFFRLGSFKAPQTYRELNRYDDFSDEVTLRFYAGTYVDKVSLFVGYQGSAHASVFVAGEGYDGWVKVESDEKIGSAFCWGDVEVKKNLESLSIVIQDVSAIIHEVAVVDADGHTIYPINYKDYPELFDEQNMYTNSPSYYYRTMFDEIYHGRTAYEFIHHLSVYENTHPPLGKTLIGIGIRIFGMTPFGWRFIPAIFGIAMVPLMYCFGKHTSKTILGAALSAWLWDTLFMSLTLSRIATIDIIVAVFAMLMYFLFYRYLRASLDKEDFKSQAKWILLCGVTTGCAVATKWTAFYVLAAMALVFFAELVYVLSRDGGFVNGLKENRIYVYKLAGVCVAAFVVIPFAIYTLSYIPFLKPYPDRNLIQQVFGNGQSMLNYHKGVTQSHPYQSSWYTWPLDIRPLLDAYTQLENGKISSVATFGNPIIFWLGIPVAIYQMIRVFGKKDFNSLILCVGYIAALLPWVFITRTVFIYQYFFCAIFLCLIIGKTVGELEVRVAFPVTIFLVFVTGVLFVMFFPELTGMAASYKYLDALEWFKTWVFV